MRYGDDGRIEMDNNAADRATIEPEHDVAQDDIAARMIAALDGASNLPLYQLRALIDGLLAEHRWRIASMLGEFASVK